MKRLITIIKDLFTSLKRTEFFSVFFSSVAGKVLSFLGGMIIVRVLSKSDYGQYAYITNCYGMLTLLGDLGCNSAALQYCNESFRLPEKANSFFVYGYTRGMAFSLFTSALILLSPLFYPFSTPEAAHMTQWLCLLPLFKTTFSFAAVNLRYRLQNKKYAKINLFHAIVTYLIIIPASYWIGVKGAVLSDYLITLISIIYSVCVSRSSMDFSQSSRLNSGERRSFLKLALGTQLNNGIDSVLMMLDIFLIGIFIGDTEVTASYKVATTIPTALAFLPASLMIYAVPHFARNSNDIGWVKKNYTKLILFGGAGYLAITAGLIVLSPFLIPLIFGTQYTDTITCFCILMIGFFFSATFRVPSANVIYTQKKVRVNIIITVLTGISNCVFDILFIFLFGSVGAACATTLVHIINSCLSFGYMQLYIHKAGSKAND